MSLVTTTLLFMCKDIAGALKDKHSVILTDKSDKAELLNKYSGSVCTVDNAKLLKVDNSLPNESVIDSVTCNTNALQNAIKKFQSNTASRPDDLPPIMFTSFMSAGELAEGHYYTNS